MTTVPQLHARRTRPKSEAWGQGSKPDERDQGPVVQSPIKGTMSPGFCSFFVITVLIIQLVTLFHPQNTLFTSKGRNQVNFRIGTKLLLVLHVSDSVPSHNDTI